VEVCGDQERRIYFKPYADTRPTNQGPDPDEPFETVPFYGLLDMSNAIRAAGLDGLYNLDAAGVTGFAKMPQFHKVGDISVSFDAPNIVLVLSSVNARHAIGPRVPMMARR
jgi:hypothetical protein